MDLADYIKYLFCFCKNKTHGVRQNFHSGIIQSEVTLENLFA